MIPKELAKQIRYIQIVTSRAVNASLAGEYNSVFKGRGMEFDEVREYQPGDEIRTIDWNVTARTGHPFVKRYVEERELTVLFAVDISASGSFGTTAKKKSEVAAELCALLAFSAIKNNDKVGMLLFAEGVELFIPPKKGVAHVLRIIREVLYYKPKGRGTDIAQALEFMARVMRRQGVIFLISDFLAPDFGKPLGLMARKHDMIAISVNDRREIDLPALGLMEFVDAETGETVMVDTSDRKFQAQYKEGVRRRQEELARMLAARAVDHIPIVLREESKKGGAAYVDDLVRFFKRREQRKR
jgi:uncharacterized protein (DUF58 family)